MKSLLVWILFSLLLACSPAPSSEMDFLVGTWKRENREQYEVWEKRGPRNLKGYSFRMKDGRKTATETLELKSIEGRWVLEATVPDQNEGQTIRFTRNTELDSLWSFENRQHDFPKKIQYRKAGPGSLEVRVLGEEGQGFSYLQIRQ